MKYMLLIAGNPEKFAALPSEETEGWMGEYFALNATIQESGEMVAGDPLHGIDTATTVSVDGGEVITTDGPYAETKETIGGYYIVDVADLDRAVEIAAMVPDARAGKVEIRPIVDLASMA